MYFLSDSSFMLGVAIEHPRRMMSDRVWEQLKAALEEAKHSRAGAPAELSDRDFLEAVLYLNRVGCPWRDLPPELGYWHAVYMRFRRSEGQQWNLDTVVRGAGERLTRFSRRRS
jgi:transposase